MKTRANLSTLLVIYLYSVTSGSFGSFVQSSNTSTATSARNPTSLNELIKRLGNSTYDLAKEMRRTTKVKKGSGLIHRIALIAERHSGSTWLFKLLQKAFPGVKVQQTVCMYKHWFQDRHREEILSGKRRCQNDYCFPCVNPESSIIFNLWRNPYDWIVALNEIPWHSISHGYQSTKGHIDFNAFVNKEWRVHGPERQYILKKQGEKAIQAPCLDNFQKNDLDFVCSKASAIYETTAGDPHYNGTQSYYAGPLEMRAAKIRDFMSVGKWAPNFYTVTYEALLFGGYDGLRDYFDAVAQRHNLTHHPEKYRELVLPTSRNKLLSTFYGSGGKKCNQKILAKCPLIANPAALQAVQSKIDHQAERLLGYHGFAEYE